jgi:hypothetical protein
VFLSGSMTVQATPNPNLGAVEAEFRTSCELTDVVVGSVVESGVLETGGGWVGSNLLGSAMLLFPIIVTLETAGRAEGEWPLYKVPNTAAAAVTTAARIEPQNAHTALRELSLESFAIHTEPACQPTAVASKFILLNRFEPALS